MKAHPPRLPLRFFRWYCHPKLLKYIEGDLLELYEERKQAKGKKSADLQFILDVILLFRPGIIRPAEGVENLTTYGMYKNYAKVGWRNLLRNKGYSFINIGGLAIGMMVAILNGLWIWNEFSWNKHFDNYDRIAEVSEVGLDLERGGTWLGTTMTYPLGTTLIEEYGQKFHRIARTTFFNESILAAGEMKITRQGMCMDPAGPEMFSFTMVHGSRQGLQETHSILISKSLAEVLFGSTDVINKIIRLDNRNDLTVTGVYEDFPHSSDFYGLHYIAPWSLYQLNNPWIEARAMNDWRNHFLKIYVEIPPGKTFSEIQAQVKTALKFAPEDAEQAAKVNRELYLYPMSEWHLHPPGLQDGAFEPVLMVTWVGTIGAFVLVLACINFINLSTARAEKRSKEVGIRKTIGSVRGQLIIQFFSESFLVVILAFALALGLVTSLLPVFNQIADKQIAMPWSNVVFWVSCLFFVITNSILAGIYPALYLSSFSPTKALKGTFRLGRLATLPRQALVVFQFCISIILIIGTAVVYQQLEFAKSRPVGYNREGLIMIPKRSNDFYGKYEVLRTELKNTGVVEEVSESMGPMTEIYSGNNGWDWKGRPAELDEDFATLAVSHLHGKTVGWQFVSGRDFDPAVVSDSLGLVINESALRVMKLDDPIGQPVTWTWWADKNRMLQYKILGVVKDMVMESPYAPAEPTIFFVKGLNGTPSWINIRINPSFSASEALPKIQSVFTKIIPSAPFEYKFADEEYAIKFGNEERIARLAGIFATLAIVISSLGLLGLAAFVAERRTKEIGIRKVLGATVAGLWSMISREFVKLVAISCMVATPIAFYLFQQWLQNFEYRTTISPWLFVLTCLMVVAFTLVTVSYQSIKAALMNPVKSLRSE